MRRPQPIRIAPQHAELVAEARRWLSERTATRTERRREPVTDTAIARPRSHH